MRFRLSEALGHLFANKAKPTTNARGDKDPKSEVSPASEVPIEEPPVILNAQSPLGLEQTQITLLEQSRTIMRLGHVLQARGASAYHIKISTTCLATTLDVDEHNAQIIFEGVSSTVYLSSYSCTAVLE